MKRAFAPAALAAALSACGGQKALPAHGEALVVVDTDLPAPALAGRLRLDLYAEDGTWFESRDVGRTDPSDWPSSFSVYSDDDAKDKLVMARLRVYPDGIVRDYAGERYFAPGAYTPAHAASSLDELCANAPLLPPGGRVTARRGGTALTQSTTTGALECDDPVRAGSVAARVEVKEHGSYRFDVASMFPFESGATLFLRATCTDPTSQIACRGEPSAAPLAPGHFPRFDVTLDPGTYYLVTGGSLPDWPADVTLESLPLDLAALPPETADAGAPPPPSSGPRLRGPSGGTTNDGGEDPTPKTEPIPSAAVDRLLLLRLVPGKRGRVRVTLRAACVGHMARLGSTIDRPDAKTATTCLDEGTLEAPLVESTLEADMTRPTDSVRGTAFVSSTCAASAPAGTDAVCLPGSLFVLGGRLVPSGVALASSTPERIAAVRPFYMDRHEVSVARFRASGVTTDALGLVVNDGSFGQSHSGDSLANYCSYSTVPAGHEDMALTCVSWKVARAFCQSAGGDLPTEAQWEYAAAAAGRPYKTLYPWGDDEPDCTRAVLTRVQGQACASRGLGPDVVGAADLGDVTPLGIVGLAGGVSEWTRDAGDAFDGACWQASGLVDPSCDDPIAPYRVLRGGSWTTRPTVSTVRTFLPGELAASGTGTKSKAEEPPRSDVGFRCVYPGGAP